MMADSRLVNLTSVIVPAVLAVMFTADVVRAQLSELDRLNRKVERLYQGARLTEALPLAKRALALAESKHDREHPTVGTSLNHLARIYERQGRYALAAPLYQRALRIVEKALGKDHQDIGTALERLATVYEKQGRYIKAETLYKRSLTIRQNALGKDHPEVGTSLNNLAGLYQNQGRYTDAEPLYKRSIAIKEKAHGPDHPSIGTTVGNLALLYSYQGRYAEAEPLYKRSLAIREKSLEPNHTLIGTSLNNLAELYRAQGRYTEAEPLFKRSLAIKEKVLGPDHPDLAAILNNLAFLYKSQGRTTEAEPLYKRSLAIAEKVLGKDHPHIGTILNNLAELYRAQGRYAKAEPLYKGGLAIREKALGPDHPYVGTSLNNLAELYRAQDRYVEAELFYGRSIRIREKALGSDHPHLSDTLNNLAFLFYSLGRTTEAAPLYRRSLAIREKALGKDHPYVANSLNGLAGLYRAQGRYAAAVDFFRRGTRIIAQRTRRSGQILGQVLTGKRKSEATQSSLMFSNFVKTAHLLALQQPGARDSLAQEMFQIAQWSQGSEAAAALARMSARQAKGDDALSKLIRERQDLVAEWQKRDAERTTAVSKQPDKRNAKAEARNLSRLAEVDKLIGGIDQRLKRDFPEYAALTNPDPLAVADVQGQLKANEAFVLFLDTPKRRNTPEETFVWVVTKTASRWIRSELGTDALKREVALLRCGLEPTLMNSLYFPTGRNLTAQQKALKARMVFCRKHFEEPKDQVIDGERVTLAPFDLKRAHKLYKALFGKVADLIKDKNLIIVPSGPLTQLPFQALVTQKPDSNIKGLDATRKAAWLIKDHAITVLPAVSSLKALRAHAKTSRATKSYIGFGNPLLEGNPKDREDAVRAEEAKAITGCASDAVMRTASLRGLLRAPRPLRQRGGLTDIADVRSQAPLPGTANEVCSVARSRSAAPSDIHLGAGATEMQIKTLSRDNALARYKVVHFSTHGALAGELKGTNEPGLILTPPSTATEQDDGYLSASEVTTLKLDADWVVLSACNTAAGGAKNAEALSGLARAFFYAGTRSLLVSHWAVYSRSTAALVSAAVGGNGGQGRAKSLQSAMRKMIDTPAKSFWSHPTYWAPFVLVGEGK